MQGSIEIGIHKIEVFNIKEIRQGVVDISLPTYFITARGPTGATCIIPDTFLKVINDAFLETKIITLKYGGIKIKCLIIAITEYPLKGSLQVEVRTIKLLLA